MTNQVQIKLHKPNIYIRGVSVALSKTTNPVIFTLYKLNYFGKDVHKKKRDTFFPFLKTFGHPHFVLHV